MKTLSSKLKIAFSVQTSLGAKDFWLKVKRKNVHWFVTSVREREWDLPTSFRGSLFFEIPERNSDSEIQAKLKWHTYLGWTAKPVGKRRTLWRAADEFIEIRFMIVVVGMEIQVGNGASRIAAGYQGGEGITNTRKIFTVSLGSPLTAIFVKNLKPGILWMDFGRDCIQCIP